MGENLNNNTQNIADYLAQLFKDKTKLAAFSNVFVHLERLLDEEISKVRSSLLQRNGAEMEPVVLPPPEGQPITLQEKVFVPVKDYPDYNFVGRILGPKGLTTKMLEQETGCRIMVRGKGSMRDKKKEEQYKGKPNYEHLVEELHVLIQTEDTPNRASLKMEHAVKEVKKLLIPVTDGEDELKKRQLMELAIIRGTYRESGTKVTKVDTPRFMIPPMTLGSPLRMPTPLGAPLIISPRLSLPTSASLLNGTAPPPLINPADAGLFYSPYTDYPYAALASPLLADYPGLDPSTAGAVAKQRRLLGVRDHPYTRTGSLS
ncbi:protein held out wings-like isoform X1 [Limulus polyphemus]|uniref:Protein held out wings-like isoform X1 n=1 Tax=Limulus polyphemus TaxID=6850 RepID=A0ABM1BC61_LIMPO|nr:protein held out wings-like isoform X1 [Limulus polyphemus]